MTPSQQTLAFRLLLTTVSIIAYAVLVQLMPLLQAVEGVTGVNTVFHLMVGAAFGAFVMAPFARAPWRVLRGIALAIAAAAIYHLAVRFVIEGPPGLDALASFTIAGASAALLCGVAVAVLAPRTFSFRLAGLLVVAGAAGGAVFDLKLNFDPDLLLGHAAWQLLSCLALNFGLRDRPT